MNRKELEERKNENMFYEKLYAKLDEMEDTGIAPEIMDIEEEKRWYREMLIESAREDGLEQGISQGIEQGLEQGIERNQKETARNMLNENLDVNLIARITNLSIDEINMIQKS